MYRILDVPATRAASALRFRSTESRAWSPWKFLLDPSLLPSLDVKRGLRIALVPLHRLLAIGHQKHRQGDGAIHFRHVVVIDFLPLVADRVVIRIIERDAERLGGHAGFGQRKIIALGEVGVAASLVLINLDTGALPGALDETCEIGIIEFGERGVGNLR